MKIDGLPIENGDFPVRYVKIYQMVLVDIVVIWNMNDNNSI